MRIPASTILHPPSTAARYTSWLTIWGGGYTSKLESRISKQEGGEELFYHVDLVKSL